jgi:hypothetical protein
MSKPSIFSDLTPLDYILAVAFVLVVSLLVNSLLPSYGWAAGILIALALLYLAKRKRDGLKNPPDQN